MGREIKGQLPLEEDWGRILSDAVGEGVIRVDRDGHVEAMNPVAERLTGYLEDDARGLHLAKIYRVFHEASRVPRKDFVDLCLAEQRTVVLPGYFVLQGRQGEESIVRDSVVPLPGGGALVVTRDLTRLRGLEKQMAYLASHDEVTGLLNRQEFEIYLEVALESARDHGAVHVLLYLDIVELKLVNDYFGLVGGDELLRQVGELLRQQVGEKGLLGRLGGDDFVLLLENRSPAEGKALAQGLLSVFRDFRFHWAGQRFDVDLSIGLLAIDGGSESVMQILRSAEVARFLARQSGRNKLHTFKPEDRSEAQGYGRLRWVQRIQRALAEDRFVLFQQEIRPLREEREPIHEILVRMLDSDGNLIPPGRFIPIAEEHDLAPELDLWVIRRTLGHLARGRAPSLAEARITLNLSGRSVGDEGFLEEVRSEILSSGIDTERLYFEITETAAVANLAAANHFIESLKFMGCRFVLDDFGSGFSSFAYLKNLPVDLLKIDGEFVRNMENDPIQRTMVASINQIGQVMGLGTIAEWVENEVTHQLLCEMGVDYVQGYHVHRPTSLIELP